MKPTASYSLLLLLFCASLTSVAQAQLNSQPIVQQMSDGNFTLCSIPDLPDSPIREQYLIENNALCFWFSKQGEKVVGLLASAGALGKDAICIEGQAQGSTILGWAIGIPNDSIQPPGYDPALLGNSIISYWISQKPSVLRLGAGTYRADRAYPYVIFSKAQLKLDGFYRYHVGKRIPPKTCQVN
ncbi:hypothetical protein BST81_15035 [Leptolyngbya sp. 'hensonii']|uniref:hypothetical protein n=1 Tax=Leptolyngbya sp. 'hensonii' TaxID=1922337 RepID=UPI00094F5BA1|nr:hypothetical protein [Leptolyngbya sp. 'hensonii']OLP17636.1 hypothetical protein BST81_15035 [Leptolyngbya sp. 'hensonii']